ncbi:unnamed protein product, partial [Pelagomonas calceolata]
MSAVRGVDDEVVVRQPDALAPRVEAGLVVDHVDLADHARGTSPTVDLPLGAGGPVRHGRLAIEAAERISKGRGVLAHRPFGGGCSPGEPSAISRVDTERHRFKNIPFLGHVKRRVRASDAAALHPCCSRHGGVLRRGLGRHGERVARSGVVRAVAVVHEHAFQGLSSILGPIADHYAGVAVDVGHGGTRCCSSAGAACMGLGAATAGRRGGDCERRCE